EPCSASAACLATWIASLAQPHGPADCVCEPDWLVEASLPAVADEAAVFDCVTEPPSPGLSTRTETAVFDGSICLASESAAADWSVCAAWSEVWIAGPEPSQPHDEPA